MNDIFDMWSLPWHALQRNLALGLGGDVHECAAPTFKAVNVQGLAASANSWLRRAQRRTPRVLASVTLLSQARL